VVELPAHRRDEPEQRLVEHRHDRAYLVEGAGTLAAELGGAPQDAHLLEQPAAHVGLFRGGQPRVVEPVDLLADAPQRVHHRPPPRLGRVGGEDGVDLQPAEQPPQHLVPVAGADRRDRRRQRVLHQPLAAAALAQGADPVTLLGQVDQLQVDGEGAGDRLGPVEVEPGHQPHHLAPRLPCTPGGYRFAR
jgi:hypothetical protein